MKTVAYDGVAAVTTDEVADALLELTVTLARFGRYDLESIPVLVQGRTEQLTVMLGPTIHVSAQTDARIEDVVIEGAPAAAARLRARSEDIAAPLGGLTAFDEDALNRFGR